MFAKRTQILKNLQSTLKANGFDIPESTAESVLKMVEIFMEPRLRPLTEKEIDEHVLVKQVHHSKKDEVRDYVRNLDYEMKREFIPEDT
jgi:hypothetical protein